MLSAVRAAICDTQGGKRCQQDPAQADSHTFVDISPFVITHSRELETRSAARAPYTCQFVLLRPGLPGGRPRLGG